jgi:hypothetical protein
MILEGFLVSQVNSGRALFAVTPVSFRCAGQVLLRNFRRADLVAVTPASFSCAGQLGQLRQLLGSAGQRRSVGRADLVRLRQTASGSITPVSFSCCRSGCSCSAGQRLCCAGQRLGHAGQEVIAGQLSQSLLCRSGSVPQVNVLVRYAGHRRSRRSTS